MRSCIRRIFKTATAACWFFQPCSACTRFCKNSLLTAATKGRSCKRLWPKRFRISNLKSSNAPIMQKASRFSHDVGSSNVPSHGSTDADDWPRILKTSHATHWHSCVSRQSELCSERFVINNQLLGQTLSKKEIGRGLSAPPAWGFLPLCEPISQGHWKPSLVQKWDKSGSGLKTGSLLWVMQYPCVSCVPVCIHA
jgi:hypothetical protein